MTASNRRDFMRLAGSAALATCFPQSIERALALPANRRTGTIQDVEHIVVLTQENRSFDHYFGSLRGVRGFGDPRPAFLPSKKSVFHQPYGAGELLPYRPDARPVGAQFLAGTPHNWPDAHKAWNNGQYDQWVAAKGPLTMAYMTREDIPFHYALADAFTICDAYHCSFMGATDPNRYYMWTGWVGNDGANGGPALDNSEAGYDWRTYPELLEKAGVSWKVYQDIGTGLNDAGSWGWTTDPYIGNYGDNSLLYFHQYQNAQPGAPLADKAKTGTNIAVGGALFDILRDDVRRNALPQVSWITAPEAYTEHSNWPVNYGAWYISQVLDALTSNPEVWSKTVLIINYDENDGFFDHVVAPYAPQSPSQGLSTVATTHEIYAGGAKYAAGPYGLGARVPLFAISPWSKGGYVCSELFDHTSVIRFIERRFGVVETQISPWRRAICGDLTSAFDFTRPDKRFVALPSTASYAPPDRQRHPSYVPTLPTQQAMPKQETGARYARPLPYALDVKGALDLAKTFHLEIANKGKAGAWLQVRSGDASSGPWSYTVEAGKSLSDSLKVPVSGLYDFSVYGPNGFLRTFKGGVAAGSADLYVGTHYKNEEEEEAYRDFEIVVANRGASARTVTIFNAYTGHTAKRRLSPGERFEKSWPLEASFGWYDLLITIDEDKSFERRLAGHIENGKDSVSDPAFGSNGGKRVKSAEVEHENE
ncbi:phosphocholine-specific phospholipase C [Methylocystis sp. Sn-Cys]|uniref:phosphocholine-specific phospholipase C n=1 Tax=Methylocystis sp. Sn-Cys TaxID=1701263 RepID=UPI0019242A76|nr:phospholipase C, phosphocholine-specific [Methylocystis sp. Sn-Cys]MBL1258457.1 phospholipase C, phosphocholine-specific [Methylocystis sp. Sn-Cys]